MKYLQSEMVVFGALVVGTTLAAKLKAIFYKNTLEKNYINCNIPLTLIILPFLPGTVTRLLTN